MSFANIAHGPHGLSLSDVRGTIRRTTSYWYVDESGNPSRKPSEDGRPFTLSAITELDPVDFFRVFACVPRDYSSSPKGEVHFNHLVRTAPEICVRLMTDFGGENVLILSKSIIKRSKLVVKVDKSRPIDETYLFAILSDLLNAILEVDVSDTVVVMLDRTDSIGSDLPLMLCYGPLVVLMADSHEYLPLQLADLSASSLRRAIIPDGKAEPQYFEKIRGKSVNLSESSEKVPRSQSSDSPTDANHLAQYKPFSSERM